MRRPRSPTRAPWRAPGRAGVGPPHAAGRRARRSADWPSSRPSPLAAHCGVSAAPRCTMRSRDVAGRRRAASAARNGSFTSRRCPITATSKLRLPFRRGHEATAGPTDGRREPCAEIAPARAAARAPAAQPAGRRTRANATSAPDRDRCSRRCRCRSTPRSAADPGKARESAGCCRRCARRAVQSSALPARRRTDWRRERHARARAESASSARVVVPFPDRDDERTGVIITMFMNETPHTPADERRDSRRAGRSASRCARTHPPSDRRPVDAIS